jgi:hypothetical protein
MLCAELLQAHRPRNFEDFFRICAISQDPCVFIHGAWRSFDWFDVYKRITFYARSKKMSEKTNLNWKHPICRAVDKMRRTHLLLPLLVLLLVGFSTNARADRFEDNDTLATATSLGVVPGVHLNDVDVNESGDQDWYKVELLRDDAIDVAIFFVHSQGDLALEVTDDGGSVLGSSNSSTDNEIVSLSGLTAGTYYIRTYGAV